MLICHFCGKKIGCESTLSNHQILGCTETSSKTLSKSNNSLKFLSEYMKKKNCLTQIPLDSNQKKNTHHIETILCERTAILEDFLLSIISMIEQKVEISGKCEYLPLLDYTQYTSSYNLVLSQ